jgi:hypothetical protein
MAQATLAEVNGSTPPSKVAELVWDAVFTKCGTSFYRWEYYTGVEVTNLGGPQPELIQWKNLQTPILGPPEKFSPAQIENGFEFSALTTIKGEMVRESFSGHTDWKDQAQMSVQLIKQHGIWELHFAFEKYSPASFLNRFVKYKPTCAEAEEAFRPDSKVFVGGMVGILTGPTLADEGFICPGTSVLGSSAFRTQRTLKVQIRKKYNGDQFLGDFRNSGPAGVLGVLLLRTVPTTYLLVREDQTERDDPRAMEHYIRATDLKRSPSSCGAPGR